MLKTTIFSTRTVITSSAMSGSDDTCCPLSLWCLQCCCWHSAGCRTSWVCLQHHATVVTSNGVTICGSKFPSTVSKHCQRQHIAIHKTIQQYEIPTIPAVVISKVLLPQSNIMAAFVHSHKSLFFDDSSNLPTYNNHITKFKFLFSTATSCRTPHIPTQNVQLPT